MSSSIEFPTRTYLNEQGELISDFRGNLEEDILIRGYKTMWITRLVDERMILLQRQGEITFAMSSRGEEACAVASAAALQKEDWIYPQYRESGVMFWRGFTIQQYIHQMFGDSEDLILGRQMPNHFGSRDLNVVQVSSPIGTKIPHAAGCAYAMKLKKEANIAVCFFGEGASSEGDFHAGLNFAAVRKAPALFFCRNNGYAISTPSRKQFASDGVAPKGIGYGIPAFRVDGNDFFAIYETMRQARRHCLEKSEPVLIEAMTYRLGPHSTADDPTLYRTEEEGELWKKKCPIERLRIYLEKNGLWDVHQERNLIETTKDEIQAAIHKARETAKPPLNSLINHVYFEIPATLQEEFEELKHLHKNT